MKGKQGRIFFHFPPPRGGEFFQVESFSGEVFQVDTEDMKKKLRSSGEVFQVGGGESFQVFGRIYAPESFKCFNDVFI